MSRLESRHVHARCVPARAGPARTRVWGFRWRLVARVRLVLAGGVLLAGVLLPALVSAQRYQYACLERVALYAM